MRDGGGTDHPVLLDEATDAAFCTDVEGVLTWVSSNVLAVLGWRPEDLIGRMAVDFIHPHDVPALLHARDEVIRSGTVTTAPLRFRTSTGGYRQMAGRGSLTHAESGAVSGRMYLLRDVHEDSARLRALTTLSRGNGVLVRAADEQELLAEMCRTVVEAGGYALSWYGRAEEGPVRVVRPLAAAGRTSYVEGLTVTWDDRPTGLGPTGTAIRTACTQVEDSIDHPTFQPWRQRARDQGFQCVIALPVVVEGRVDGALTVYADEPDAFDATARGLLEDLAADLGYGIHRLRDALRLAEALSSSVFALAAAVESRDPYTAGHQSHVGVLCERIGLKMGLDPARLEGVVLGGSIHDLGKISIGQETLNKHGRLTAEEWEALQQHPVTGYQITSRFPWPWPIAEMIHQHHERLDGSGYPRGLRGDQILLEARIISVADVYEAMANDRPYREAPGHERALDVLLSGAGVTFDPEVVAALEKVLDNGFTFATDGDVGVRLGGFGT